MKISKIFAGMSAMAIAATMAISASATGNIHFEVDDPQLEEVTGDDGGVFVQYTIPDADPFAISKIQYVIKDNAGEGFGGAFVFNSDVTQWQSINELKWTNPGGDTASYPVEAVDNGDGTYLVTFDVAEHVKKLLDDKGSDGTGLTYAQLTIQAWWGDSTIVEIRFNDDVVEPGEQPSGDSSAPESSTPESSATESKEESKAASSTATTASKAASTAATGTTSTAASSDNTATGATAGIALAGLALAGAVAVVSKRK